MREFFRKPSSIMWGFFSIVGFVGAYFSPTVTTFLHPFIPISELMTWVALYALAAIATICFFSLAVEYWQRSAAHSVPTLAGRPVAGAASTKEELVDAAVGIFKMPGVIKVFIQACVKQPLQNTVERDNEITDSKEDEHFPIWEIQLMKDHALREIEYAYDPNNDAIFKIKVGDESVVFSNRDSSRGEMRGQVLRAALDRLKIENPKMSLYDALSQLVRNYEKMALYLFTPFLFDRPAFALPQDQNIFLRVMNKLCLACAEYIIAERSKGALEDDLTDRLERVIQENMRVIMTMALSDEISVSGIKQRLSVGPMVGHDTYSSVTQAVRNQPQHH